MSYAEAESGRDALKMFFVFFLIWKLKLLNSLLCISIF